MATKTVWIEEGCITCSSCEAECPEVFVVTATTCLIRSDARQDGAESENRIEKSPLRPEIQAALDLRIKAAVTTCPVTVIHYESVSDDGP